MVLGFCISAPRVIVFIEQDGRFAHAQVEHVMDDQRRNAIKGGSGKEVFQGVQGILWRAHAQIMPKSSGFYLFRMKLCMPRRQRSL